MTYESTYLAHYGVKGQKWGIRRYQNEDGSLTSAGKERYAVSLGGNRRFERKYKREASKLAKLATRADIETQNASAERHGKAAKTAARVGAAVLGTGAAAFAGNRKFSNTNERGFLSTEKAVAESEKRLRDAEKNYHKEILKSRDINQTTKAFTDAQFVYEQAQMLLDGYKKSHANNAVERTKLLNAKSAREKAIIGATAALATAAFTTAGYHKVQQVIAKNRTTPLGHLKATEKRDKQVQKMMNMFAGTKYSQLVKAQIEAYKDEHPNTQLTDKQIAKNLS